MAEGSQGHLQLGLERLYRRQAFGIKPGLEPVRRLCRLLGDPQARLAPIHIAGTNGKGSTAAIVEAVLRVARLRPGLYTSPHLVRFQERIRIDGQDVEDALLAEVLEKCEAVAPQVLAEIGHDLTFFEISTAMAFLCFVQSDVRLAVVETGLGGRLDATNVVEPLVSVITRIGMDHEQYLGNTIEKVAGEKAGIIKRGRPVVSGPQVPEAEAVLRRVAREQGAPFLLAPDVVSVRGMGAVSPGQKVQIETQGGWVGQAVLPLDGPHQLENLGIALATLEQVLGVLGISLPFEVVREGLAAVRWRGRFEQLQADPIVIADAAHNPDGARALVKALRGRKHRRVILVTGMCVDKDVDAVVSELARVAGFVYCVPISNPRGILPGRLTAGFARHGVSASEMPSVEEALKCAKAQAREQNVPVVVAGSIFLLGDLLACQ